MSPDEFDDFLRELHVAVHEEQSLWEVPRESIDKLPSGDLAHGPWRPEDCSRVLAVRLDAGLLSLYRCDARGSAGDYLPHDEARAILLATDQWVEPEAWTDVVNLAVTEVGSDTRFEGWAAKLGRPET